MQEKIDLAFAELSRADPYHQLLWAIRVAPGKPAEMALVGRDIQSLRRAVGGDIELTFPFPHPIAMLTNETGKLDGLPINRAIYFGDGRVQDIIFGTFYLFGFPHNATDITDFPPELARDYLVKFINPPSFGG